MTQSITLTAQQAAELHTTGRLTGYREKCEWQPPESFFDYLARLHLPNEWELKWRKHPALDEFHYKYLTPPRDTDTTYAVKEPCVDGEPADEWEFDRSNLPNPGHEMPTQDHPLTRWAVRQHARITDIKLIIEDGELWWDFGDLEKVEKA